MRVGCDTDLLTSAERKPLADATERIVGSGTRVLLWGLLMATGAAVIWEASG